MGWFILKSGIGVALCGALTYVGLTTPEKLDIRNVLHPVNTPQESAAPFRLSSASLQQLDSVLSDLRWSPPRPEAIDSSSLPKPAELVVGLTKNQVAALKGAPSENDYRRNAWVYDDLTVFFDGFQVTGWMRGQAMLHDAPAPAHPPVAPATPAPSARSSFMTHLGSGSIKNPSASKARSYSSRHGKGYTKVKSAAPRSAFFQQNRRTYSNFTSKPSWLRQWSAYREFSQSANPRQYGNAGSRYRNGSWLQGSQNGRSSR